jgi:DNA-binding HxlR family transcriptional regulator
MGTSYHQFCSVAKAMELLDERWTLLIVRELVAGSERFNELRRGVPRMSPTLLSKRLNQLVRAGVVDEDLDPELLLWDIHREYRLRCRPGGTDGGAVQVSRRAVRHPRLVAGDRLG